MDSVATQFYKDVGFYDYLDKLANGKFYHKIIRIKKDQREKIVLGNKMLDNTKDNCPFIDYDKDKNSFGIIKEDNLVLLTGNIDIGTKFKHTVKVKIRSFETSSDLFGYRPTKEDMSKSGAVYGINKVFTHLLVDKDADPKVHVRALEIYNPTTDRSYKFLIEDLELIYPDLTKLTKGYTPKLNRTVVKGQYATVNRRNSAKLEYGQKVLVKDFVNIGNKTLCRVLVEDKIYILPRTKLITKAYNINKNKPVEILDKDGDIIKKEKKEAATLFGAGGQFVPPTATAGRVTELTERTLREFAQQLERRTIENSHTALRWIID